MSAQSSLSKLSILALPCAALVTFGCDDALKRASLIQETRVIGARVEVTGDALRASPGPGEAGHLRLFVAAPNGQANVAYAFTLCGVAQANSGFPSCSTPSFASAYRASPSTADAEFDFQVPADLDLTSAPHGFVRGIVCPDGPAELTPDGSARCSAGPGDAVAFEFDLAGPGEDNDNPTFGPDAVTLDGAAWPPSDPSAACAALSVLSAGTTHRLGVQLSASDFDSLAQVSAEDPPRETLLLSQFSSAGTLAHTFVSVRSDRPDLAGAVDYTAPARADPSGTVVHFYVVVRDARGGEDLATRALCVVP